MNEKQQIAIEPLPSKHDLHLAAAEALNLSPAQEDINALRAERDALRKQVRILELAIPLEDELHDEIDQALRSLAMEQGYTPSGLAKILDRCQKRMAADWLEVGAVRLATNAITSIIREMRLSAMVSGQALVDGDGTVSAMAAAEAERATSWADRIASALTSTESRQ